jgi:hypothetical protein
MWVKDQCYCKIRSLPVLQFRISCLKIIKKLTIDIKISSFLYQIIKRIPEGTEGLLLLFLMSMHRGIVMWVEILLMVRKLLFNWIRSSANDSNVSILSVDVRDLPLESFLEILRIGINRLLWSEFSSYYLFVHNINY